MKENQGWKIINVRMPVEVFRISKERNSVEVVACRLTPQRAHEVCTLLLQQLEELEMV